MMAYDLSRRQMVAGAIAGLVALPIRAVGAAGDGIVHGEEAIHQEPKFRASPRRVYDILTESRQFGKIVELSGAMQSMSPGSKAAEISREIGGPFALFGGHIVGRHIELIPGVRIVQAWRVVDWQPGVYSIARFELSEAGGETKLVFDHTGFPRGLAEHLAAGWEEHYWEPLRKFLA